MFSNFVKIFLLFILLIIIKSSCFSNKDSICEGKKLEVPSSDNTAKPGDFAKTVLMPGDPLRSKAIAERFLEDPKLVNNVRGIQGYTGKYKGKLVSVMASGMGIPSMANYAYEFYHYYNVDNIIRIGTIGSMKKDIKIKDLIIAVGASTTSNYAKDYGLPGKPVAVASFDLLTLCDKIGSQLGLSKNMHFGTILTADVFYDDDSQDFLKWIKMGTLGAEMETAGLYYIAARAGKKALSICTVSDNPITGETTSSEEREKSFDDMAELALNMAISIDQ